ncbi:MAG: murein peptide amidase A [Gammaproteobacteria bacterium]|nr:murein peptide amidase A [Gammaproteobacteria bacterium]
MLFSVATAEDNLSLLSVAKPDGSLLLINAATAEDDLALSGDAIAEVNPSMFGVVKPEDSLLLMNAATADDDLAQTNDAEDDLKQSNDEAANEVLAQEIESFCQRVDKKLSSVNQVECVRIGLRDSGADSLKATPLFYKDFGSEDKSAARVLLIGGIHGDEYSSVSIVFKWLAMLEEDLGDRFQWRVIPVLNPDGLLRPPRMSQRMNANGVDLNRNFPTPDWEEKAHEHWVQRARKNKRRYPGPAPLSEPETAWLVEQIEVFQPHAVVSVHAPHGVVDFDGPRVPPEQLGPLELKLLGTYPGSMGRYIGIHKGIPLLTLELESAFGMPAQNEVYAIWYDMLGWLQEKIALPLKLAEERERAPATDVLRVGADPDNEG